MTKGLFLDLLGDYCRSEDVSRGEEIFVYCCCYYSGGLLARDKIAEGAVAAQGLAGGDCGVVGACA